MTPEQLVYALSELATGLPSYQRVSAGFPGMVREGRLISAPHFVSPTGPGGKPTPELEKAWADFDLQGALATALGKPCRVANDADVQGAALVKGEGLEFVITLGTGVGTALFWKGKLAPHVELAHHPLGKGARSYNDMLGEAALTKVGHKKWNARVAMMLGVVKALVFYDHCYIGGGNSHKVKIRFAAGREPGGKHSRDPRGHQALGADLALRRARRARSSGPRRGAEDGDVAHLQQNVLPDVVPVNRVSHEVVESRPIIGEQPRVKERHLGDAVEDARDDDEPEVMAIAAMGTSLRVETKSPMDARPNMEAPTTKAASKLRPMPSRKEIVVPESVTTAPCGKKTMPAIRPTMTMTIAATRQNRASTTVPLPPRADLGRQAVRANSAASRDWPRRRSNRRRRQPRTEG